MKFHLFTNLCLAQNSKKDYYKIYYFTESVTVMFKDLPKHFYTYYPIWFVVHNIVLCPLLRTTSIAT